jgi:phosphohistidine phosphatase SixA
MSRPLRLFIPALLFVIWTATADALADPRTVNFVQSLQQGGYVVYFRHGSTDHSQKDTDRSNLGDCTSQRNLDSRGRQQAETIGRAFRELGIPVGQVYSSRYCRCLDTVRIAFGRAETRETLTSFMDLPEEEQRRRVLGMQRLLATPPAAGTNNILVSHKYMFQNAAGLTLEEGEAAIYKPMQNRFQLIARIKAQNWPQVVGEYRATVSPVPQKSGIVMNAAE